MTSSVKIAAHCAPDKVVLALVFDNTTGICSERHELEDGKEIEISVYDNKAVTTMEVLKADLVTPDTADPLDAETGEVVDGNGSH